MKLALDRYAYLDSVIHQWEQRSKLIALLPLIFAFAFVEHLILLPAMLLLTATLFYLSRLPFSFLLSRLRYPGWFILGVVIFLPFVAGDTALFSLGFLEIKQEGCLQVLLIITRFLCILTVSLILFGTAPFLTSIKALRSLGLPDTIVDMMLLSYRYLEELGDTL
ncbi:MAG: CbiQ family ECF transporter T component, partial [Spirulinaceae cyanobacterium]